MADLFDPGPSDFQQLRDELVRVGLATPATIIGVSDVEIAQIEAANGARLPGSYRRFLAIMGKRAGTLGVGTDFFYPRCLDLRGSADRLLAETDYPFALQPSDTVVGMHQGYIIYLLRGQADDPHVWTFVEGDQGPRESNHGFASFLASGIPAHLRR